LNPKAHLQQLYRDRLKLVRLQFDPLVGPQNTSIYFEETIDNEEFKPA
jgi:hypothetical protein